MWAKPSDSRKAGKRWEGACCALASFFFSFPFPFRWDPRIPKSQRTFNFLAKGRPCMRTSVLTSAVQKWLEWELKNRGQNSCCGDV